MADAAQAWPKSFGEVEAGLAAMYDVASTKRTQFVGRLRNFQRSGIPQGVSTGRGRAAMYSPMQVYEMILALELTGLGLLPERVVDLLNFNKAAIATATTAACYNWRQSGIDTPSGLLDDSDEIYCPLAVFIHFDPSGLHSLTREAEDGGDRASRTLTYSYSTGLAKIISDWGIDFRRRAIACINLTATLFRFMVHFDDSEDVLPAVERWGHEQNVRGVLDDYHTGPTKRLLDKFELTDDELADFTLASEQFKEMTEAEQLAWAEKGILSLENELRETVDGERKKARMEDD